MHHVALMKKSWMMIPKMLSGEKTIESRWYQSKQDPFNKTSPGDTIYFQNAREPVTAKANVVRVEQFTFDNDDEALDVAKKFGERIGLPDILPEYIMNKHPRYAVLMWVSDATVVEPFEIDRTGYPIGSGWFCIEDINLIRT